MKFKILSFFILASVGARPFPSIFYQDSIDADVSYDEQDRETEIISLLRQVHTNERAAASYLPRGCSYEGKGPFCKVKGCPLGLKKGVSRLAVTENAASLVSK